MKINDFKGKKITVMGIGLHGGGIATVRFFALASARVTATDIKSEKELAPSLEKLKDLKNVKFVLGQHRMEDFTSVDMVVKGPAVPWGSKHIQAALKHNVPVEMDSSIFFKLCKLPIVGVTGTKGKTTTATLIVEILKRAGKKVFTVGIGQKPVLDAIDDIVAEKTATVVFELSSWRLSALGRARLSPHIAVITNIFPDHMNYYARMEKYIADKKYIFENQKEGDWLVLNYDDEYLQNIQLGERKNIVFYTTTSLDHPVEDRYGYVFIRGERVIAGLSEDNKPEVCKLSDIKVSGEHNVSNVLAAVAAALACGVAPEKIREAVKNFGGVPHRLELVRELDGVKYVNDTAATIPDAAIAGLNSLEGKITLIAGGADKNLDFKDFAQAVNGKVRNVILLKGEATEKIKTELKKIGAEKKVDSEFSDMGKAIIRAKNISGPGDIVLLSPGAASFGLFLNEFDRGDKFREAVGKLT